MAQKAANAMSSGMEQMAGHAGMGVNPYMQPAGQPVQRLNSTTGSAAPGTSSGFGGQQSAGPGGAEPSTPPQQTTAYSNPSAQELPVSGVDPAMPDFETPPDPPTAELPTTNYDPNTEAGEDA
jgi:hypothetical protein